MYVQQTFQETFELLAKNPKNVFVYLAPQVVLGILGLLAYALFMGAARAIGFFAKQSAMPSWLGILLLAFLAVFFLVLIPLGIALLVFYNRAAYLTSKGTEIPLSSASAQELFHYVKLNFLPFLKLALLMFLAMAACILAVVVIFLLMVPFGLTIKGMGGIAALALMAVACMIFAAMYLLLYVTMNTSFALFFMGNEQAGAIELARRAFSLVRGNLVEYVLLALGYFVVSLGFVVLYILLAMTCILQPVAYGLMVAFQFGVYVSMFVFLGKLLPKPKK